MVSQHNTKMSRCQSKVSSYTKNQKDLKLNERRIDRCQDQDDRVARIIWQRFLGCHDKNASISNYGNNENTGNPSKDI